MFFSFFWWRPCLTYCHAFFCLLSNNIEEIYWRLEYYKTNAYSSAMPRAQFLATSNHRWRTSSTCRTKNPAQNGPGVRRFTSPPIVRRCEKWSRLLPISTWALTGLRCQHWTSKNRTRFICACRLSTTFTARKIKRRQRKLCSHKRWIWVHHRNRIISIVVQ